MLIVETAEHQDIYRRLAHDAARVVFVPTMGNLHAGHQALIEHAKTLGDLVVVSLFVNPTQFGPGEDYDRYPRTRQADLTLCQQLGVQAVWLPTIEQLYPEGLQALDQFSLQPPASLVTDWCGASRPGHFAGVCLVLAKLFHLVQPDRVVMGEKDAQQVAVVRRLIRDLMFPIELVEYPVVREANGLALSSRNQYLDTPDKRRAALTLSETLRGVCQLYQVLQQSRPGQPIPVAWAFQQVTARMNDASAQTDSIEWEYQGAVDRDSFDRQTVLTPQSRLLVAGKVAGVRLIDTCRLVED